MPPQGYKKEGWWDLNPGQTYMPNVLQFMGDLTANPNYFYFFLYAYTSDGSDYQGTFPCYVPKPAGFLDCYYGTDTEDPLVYFSEFTVSGNSTLVAIIGNDSDQVPGSTYYNTITVGPTNINVLPQNMRFLLRGSGFSTLAKVNVHAVFWLDIGGVYPVDAVVTADSGGNLGDYVTLEAMSQLSGTLVVTATDSAFPVLTQTATAYWGPGTWG
jgi:hypothetical protein